MTGETRQCPECGGRIHAIAGRCKHCKATLSPSDADARHVGAAQAGVDVAVMAGNSTSTWLGRWPLIVVAVSLLAIGISIGMMLERWLQANRDSAIEHRSPGNRPREVPDRMPRADPRPDPGHPR